MLRYTGVTSRGEGTTRIGNGVYLMAYAHIAHDCQLGNGVLMANAATLGGHVTVGECAVLGGIVAVHQFVRIGEYSCIGGFAGTVWTLPLICWPRAPNRPNSRRKRHRPQTQRLFRRSYPGDKEMLQGILPLRSHHQGSGSKSPREYRAAAGSRKTYRVCIV